MISVIARQGKGSRKLLLMTTGFRCASSSPVMVTPLMTRHRHFSLRSISAPSPTNISMVSLQHCKFKSAQFSFLSTTIQPLNRTGEALKETPVRILWASQTGTAQLFAQQLSEALEEREQEYDIKGWHESKDPTELLQPGNGIHLFLTATEQWDVTCSFTWF